MSKKPVAVRSEQWFSNSRDYNHIAKVEAEFLKALLRKKNDGHLHWTIHKALNEAAAFLNEPTGTVLDILIECDVVKARSNKAQKIYLGTKLDPGISGPPEVSHSISIGEGDRCLTKVHADLDFDLASAEKKPSPHCQIGGRPPRRMEKNHPGALAWDEHEDKPRMPCLPFCTPLLWHWAFFEFPECEAASITSAPWWQTIVHCAEREVLLPFFNDGVTLSGRQKRPSCVFGALYTPTNKS